MGKPVILYRDFDLSPTELRAAKEYFPCTDSRMDIKPGDLVIGRYSVLPFYTEQERDIQKAGATLINSYDQHDYLADLRRWYQDLQGLTPRTWLSSEEMMADKSYAGPYVVKGITNSKKFNWSTHMFASDKKAAIQVMSRLQEDSLIGFQPIVFREYVPLKKLCDSVGNSAPITNEFRFFFAYGEQLCGAYYWSSYTEDLPVKPDPSSVPQAFLAEVNERIKLHANFYVVDVAQTEKGDWIVIELNDGQQSGLSDNSPVALYRWLLEAVYKRI